jgi:penicillin-binding protein 1A
VGTFVGFDDNRSLGDKETGAVAAVPIFIDFMQQALKDLPAGDFKVPGNAVFGYVHGVREAFQPGTEPKASPVDVLDAPFGPAPGQIPDEGPVALPPAAIPPRSAQKGDALQGLF